jgi:hypothetical protein
MWVVAPFLATFIVAHGYGRCHQGGLVITYDRQLVGYEYNKVLDDTSICPNASH